MYMRKLIINNVFKTQMYMCVKCLYMKILVINYIDGNSKNYF